MIDFDYAPAVFAGVIALVFIAPTLYSFFVDNWDKKSAGVIADKAQTK